MDSNLRASSVLTLRTACLLLLISINSSIFLQSFDSQFSAHAQPYLASRYPTLTAELNATEIAVIARLIEVKPTLGGPADDEFLARFEVVQVLKGDKIEPKLVIEEPFFGEEKPGSLFLLSGWRRKTVFWRDPVPISARSQAYLGKLLALPKAGVERLAFFLDYLNDSETFVVCDAHNEFTKVDYKTLTTLKSRLNHDQILEWLQDSKAPHSRRRLLFLLLSICGNEKDIPLLEQRIREQTPALDACITCYIQLRGAEALEFVDELCLKPKDARYETSLNAIASLRFHASSSAVVPRQRLLDSLRLVLDRPKLAHSVIPDLAKMKDWDSMDRLMDLYRKADEKSLWIRTPVVEYLQSCPLPRAKVLLDECRTIDAAAVRRAEEKPSR